MGLKALFKELTGKAPDLADYSVLRSNTYLTNVKTELGQMSWTRAIARRNRNGQWHVSYNAYKTVQGHPIEIPYKSWKNVTQAEMERLMDAFECQHKHQARLNRFRSSYQRVLRPGRS